VRSRNEPAELPRIGAVLAALRGWTLRTCRHHLRQCAAGLAALQAPDMKPEVSAAGCKACRRSSPRHAPGDPGQLPGVASLRAQQYYGHPRNHFWPLVGALWGLDLLAMPYATTAGCAAQARGLGLWDVYASCRREGSLDQAIREAQFNDLASLRGWHPGCAWWPTTVANRRVP
jgi:hypothetical protein